MLPSLLHRSNFSYIPINTAAEFGRLCLLADSVSDDEFRSDCGYGDIDEACVP